MKGRREIRFVGIAIILFLLVITPGQVMAQSETGPIKIGMSVPLSGHSADPGEQISLGARLAVDIANKAGGINGRKVELDIQDDAANPTTGVALLDRFAQEGVVGAIGYFNSAVGLAAQKLAEAKQIPLMVQGINSAINNPWTYHSVATDSEQARGAMLFLRERGHKKFAIMTDTSAFGTAALEQLKIALKNAKLEPVTSQTFEVEASDLTPQLLRIKNAGADAIILFTVGPPMARVMQGLAQINYKIPVVGNFTAADAAVARIGGTVVDGLYYQDMVHPGKDLVKQINTQYKSFNPGKGDIGVYSVVAYDQATILLEGIKAGATTGPKMKKFLDQFSSKTLASGAPGATWKYTEADHGGLKAEDLVWVVYKKGVRTPVDPKAK